MHRVAQQSILPLIILCGCKTVKLALDHPTGAGVTARNNIQCMHRFTSKIRIFKDGDTAALFSANAIGKRQLTSFIFPPQFVCLEFLPSHQAALEMHAFHRLLSPRSICLRPVEIFFLFLGCLSRMFSVWDVCLLCVVPCT